MWGVGRREGREKGEERRVETVRERVYQVVQSPSYIR